MRRAWLIVLAVFFLILPVSAQADGAETQLGALVLKKGAESAQTTIRNDTAYPVYVLARATPPRWRWRKFSSARWTADRAPWWKRRPTAALRFPCGWRDGR